MGGVQSRPPPDSTARQPQRRGNGGTSFLFFLSFVSKEKQNTNKFTTDRVREKIGFDLKQAASKNTRENTQKYKHTHLVTAKSQFLPPVIKLRFFFAKTKYCT